MAFAQKLFNAAFAGAAGPPILEQQENRLQLLREKLNQIATTQRALAVQELSGDQAMERTQFQQGQQNFREKLAQIAQTGRNTDSIEARQSETAAELGIQGVTEMNSSQIIEAIAQKNAELKAAETEEESLKAIMDRHELLINLQEKTGLPVGPEVLEDPRALREFQVRLAEHQAREELEDTPALKLPLGIIAEIEALGPAGADFADSMMDQASLSGIPADPATQAFLMIGKLKALQGEKPSDGFTEASRLVAVYEDNIIRRYFPGARLPSESDLLIAEPEVQEAYDKLLTELEALHSDPAFSLLVKRETGFSPEEVAGISSIDLDYLYRSQATMQDLRAEAEEDAARQDILRDSSAPRDTQRTRLTSRVQDAIVQEALALESPEEFMALVEKRSQELMAAPLGQLPNSEYLKPEDIQQIIQEIQAMVQEILQVHQQLQMSAPEEDVAFKGGTRPQQTIVTMADAIQAWREMNASRQ